MQQVFEAVNDLLQRSTRRARGLRLRTYAIVPLSPQAGVLEWVRHTLPFGAYLSDRGRARGAHGRSAPPARRIIFFSCPDGHRDVVAAATPSPWIRLVAAAKRLRGYPYAPPGTFPATSRTRSAASASTASGSSPGPRSARRSTTCFAASGAAPARGRFRPSSRLPALPRRERRRRASVLRGGEPEGVSSSQARVPVLLPRIFRRRARVARGARRGRAPRERRPPRRAARRLHEISGPAPRRGPLLQRG